MCNGDLGMYRVMPWSLPPIYGGQENTPKYEEPIASFGSTYITMANDHDQITIWLQLRDVIFNNKDLISSVSSDLKIPSSMTLEYLDSNGDRQTGTFSVNTDPISTTVYVPDSLVTLVYKYNVTSKPSNFSSGRDQSVPSYTLTKFTIYNSAGTAIQEISV